MRGNSSECYSFTSFQYNHLHIKYQISELNCPSKTLLYHIYLLQLFLQTNENATLMLASLSLPLSLLFLFLYYQMATLKAHFTLIKVCTA